MFRSTCLVPPLLLYLLLTGCLTVRETQSKHVIHRGEDAVLVSVYQAPEVYVGSSGEATREVAKAQDSGNRSRLAELVAKGEAFAVPASVLVHVAAERSNERRIRVLEGDHRGREGWVQFEWLKPAPGR